MSTFGFPPVPEWVPAVERFWGPPTAAGLDWSPDEVRREWLAAALSAPAARAFATACARRALRIYGSDERPFRAVEAAERYAFGLVTADESTAASYVATRAMSDDLAVRNRSLYPNEPPFAYDEATTAVAGAAEAGDSADCAADAAAAAAETAATTARRDAYQSVWSGYRPNDDWAWEVGDAAADAAGAEERLAQARLLWLAVPPAGGPLTAAAHALVAAWLDAWFRLGEDDRVCRGAVADALEEGGHTGDCPRLRALREMDDWHPGLWPMSPGP